MKRLRVLFDSGCAATLINHKFTKHLREKAVSTTKWKTKAGKFETNKRCKINFTLPKFHENREIEWKAYVEESDVKTSRYDMIIGRDLMHEIGIDLLFSEQKMQWGNAKIPM